MFERALGGVSVADFNAAFRGEVYGEQGVDADWFAEHVAHNGIDPARSPRWSVRGAFAGMALLAFRGDRAWVGAFGVVPALRGRGYARRFVADVLALAADAGAVSVELEVLERNPAAIALYGRGDFETTGELVVWTRAALAVDAEGTSVGARAFAAADVAAVARTAAASWQREPASVAAASPAEVLVVGAARAGEPAAPQAYAFVRRAAARAAVLDAGAHDAAAAVALLAALDARVPGSALLLLNEPPRGPLHDALAAHPAWSELARQRRMVARVR